MKINTVDVMNGLHDGDEVWICQYLRPDLDKKPLRNVPPIKCVIRPISELPKNKTIYYSVSFFSPLNKKGQPTNKCLSPVDNTGFRSLCGNKIDVFDSEYECVASWNDQISSVAERLDCRIKTAEKLLIDERAKILMLMVS